MSDHKKLLLSKEEMEKIFGIEATASASEEQKSQAYYYLGVLATTFSEIETGLQSLIGIMEGLSFNGYKLIDDNSLERNLQLLASINKWQQFRVTEVSAFTKAIRKIKADRNNLIHGIWKIFLNNDFQPVVSVKTSKSKVTIENGSRTFRNSEQHIYTFIELTQLIEKAKQLNEDLKDLITFQITKDKPGSEEMIRQLLNKKND